MLTKLNTDCKLIKTISDFLNGKTLPNCSNEEIACLLEKCMKVSLYESGGSYEKTNKTYFRNMITINLTNKQLEYSSPKISLVKSPSGSLNALLPNGLILPYYQYSLQVVIAILNEVVINGKSKNSVQITYGIPRTSFYRLFYKFQSTFISIIQILHFISNQQEAIKLYKQFVVSLQSFDSILQFFTIKDKYCTNKMSLSITKKILWEYLNLP